MAKNMTKRLIALFLCVTMVGVLLLAGVNFFVDPFHFFRWNSGISQDPGDPLSANRRVRAASVLKNSPSDTYQGIIVGGSKSWPISEGLMHAYTGLNWLSCAVMGGNFNDYEDIIRYALQHQNLDYIILHLSGAEVIMTGSNAEWYRMPNFVTTDNDIKDNLYYLFSGFETSIDHLASGTASTLAERFDVQELNQFDYSPLNKQNFWIAEGLGINKIKDMDEKTMNAAIVRIQTVCTSRFQSYYSWTLLMNEKEMKKNNSVLNDYGITYNERLYNLFNTTVDLINKKECLIHLQNIVNLCKENDVQLTVILGAAFLGERANYEGIEYWDYLYQIAQITDFYDFSYFCDINMNPYNFFDHNHNLDFVSYVMVDNIYGEGVIPFGQKVTAENFDEYITQRRADYFALEQEYRETGTVQLEALGSESDLSSLPGEFWLEMLSRAGKNAA